MKLKNTTDYPDHFLRRLCSWCCKQIGFPVRRLCKVEFGNRTNASYQGWAFGGGRILVRIGPESRFPLAPDDRPGMGSIAFIDRMEVVVALTAHEIAHLLQYREGRCLVLRKARRTEKDARFHEVRALLAFRAERESLVAEWSIEPQRREIAELSVQDRRAAKADKMLANWQRKAKLATTKVRQYKRRVAYYEKALAAKRQT